MNKLPSFPFFAYGQLQDYFLHGVKLQSVRTMVILIDPSQCHINTLQAVTLTDIC
jgi:hypothetical protein